MSIRKIIASHWFIMAVILIASLLRLWRLGDYPIHLTNDEAALGYNAYSILKTGRDEHGELLPIVFKSFGDWKPGIYVYFTVPFVFLFGLTETAVRLPSAIAGVLAVYLMYLIGKKLINKQVGLFAALSLSLMPWHIHFSRGAWEANIALTLLLVAIYFFIKSLEKNKYLFLSAVFFGITLWAYQSAKLASALALFALVFVYRDRILSVNKKQILASAIVGLVISAPIILSIFSGKGGRIEVMSVFSYTRPEEYIQATVFDQEDISKNSLTYMSFHSESFNLFRGVLGRYFNYFSGRFLFFEGDWTNPKHTSPGVGYLLFASIPILLIGVFSLLKQIDKKPYVFVFMWLVLAPIPAALTRDSAHGVRALNLVAPLSFVLAFGFVFLFNTFKNKMKTKVVLGSAIVGIYFYSLLIYADAYFIQSPIVNAGHYLYGYKQTVQEVMKLKNNYEKIVFDQSFDQPYIYLLFYTAYPPDKYQQKSAFVDGVNGDVGFVEQWENIEFRPINWSADKSLENTLLVGKPLAFPPEEVSKPQDYKTISVNFPDDNPAFLLVDPI